MSHINRTLSILLSLMMLCVCLSAGAETATGVYEGASTGFSGDVVATLTLEDGTMTGLVFDESANANQILTDEQRTDFAQSIIQAGTPLVDTVAGATITSNAMIEATKDALAKAGITEYREAEKVTYSADDISFVPGEYTSTKMGMNGEITVKAVFSDKTIESIEVTDHMETTGVGTAAFRILADHILTDQSLGMDIVSGATYTSLGYLAALEDCVEQAGGNVAALKAQPVHYDTYADMPHDADMLIIGGGMAGMSAALSGVQNGLSVILLEQKEFLGGNALAATGTYLLGNTEVQKAQGIQDDPEVFYNWILETIPNADTGLAHMLVDHSQDLIDFYEANGLTFDYGYMKATTNSEIARGHQILPTGADSVEIMIDILKRNQVDVRYLTRAEELLTDENGRVIGVSATDAEGNPVAYYGNAVILASGGFGENQDVLAASWGEECRNLKFGGIKGSDGSMLEAAVSLGADTVDMDATHIDATLEVTHQIMADTNIITSCGGIIVRTSTSERLADESYNHGDAISAAELQTGDDYYYMIFDGSALEFSDALKSKVSMYINTGLAETYTDLSQLAAGCALDEETITRVLDDYNAAVRGEKEDAFGRTSFYGELTAPYYVMKVSNGVVMTSGGIKVDDHSRVISTDGQPIEGLYAIGEVSGGLMRVYIAGASLSECGISGMLLGQQLSGAVE